MCLAAPQVTVLDSPTRVWQVGDSSEFVLQMRVRVPKAQEYRYKRRELHWDSTTTHGHCSAAASTHATTPSLLPPGTACKCSSWPGSRSSPSSTSSGGSSAACPRCSSTSASFAPAWHRTSTRSYTTSSIGDARMIGTGDAGFACAHVQAIECHYVTRSQQGRWPHVTAPPPTSRAATAAAGHWGRSSTGERGEGGDGHLRGGAKGNGRPAQCG